MWLLLRPRPSLRSQRPKRRGVAWLRELAVVVEQRLRASVMPQRRGGERSIGVLREMIRPEAVTHGVVGPRDDPSRFPRRLEMPAPGGRSDQAFRLRVSFQPADEIIR